jgi:hypothetical protein
LRNKQSVVPTDETAETPADSGADSGAGGGGGGGASAPSQTDVAMGQMAKEDVKKSMDLGGLDMASPKVEKGAMVTGMVASMVASGKDVAPSLARTMMNAPLPTPAKDKIVSRVINSKDAPNRGILTNVPTSAKVIKGTAISRGAKSITTRTPLTPFQQVSKAVAKTPQVQVAKAVAKPVIQVNKAVAKAVAKPVSKAIAKFKKFDGNYGFDGEDMFANAVSTNKQCHYENEIIGYSSTGNPIVQQKLVCNTIGATAKFDGDYEMSNFSGASDF